MKAFVSNNKRIVLGIVLMLLGFSSILLRIYDYSILVFVMLIYCIPIGSGIICFSSNAPNINIKQLPLGIFGVICALMYVGSLPGVAVLITEDPFKWFVNIEDSSDLGMLVLVGSIIYSIMPVFLLQTINRFQNNKKYIVLGLIALIYVAVLSLTYVVFTPKSDNIVVMTQNEFRQKLSSMDYTVTEVNGIEGIDNIDGKILVAEREGTIIYLITSENILIAKNNYIKVDDIRYTCSERVHYMNYFYKKGAVCKDKNTFIIVSRVKNTIIYSETALENRSVLESFIEQLGY